MLKAIFKIVFKMNIQVLKINFCTLIYIIQINNIMNSGCLQKAGEVIKYISIGKYRTLLYYKNREFYSSVSSGSITIICVSILLVYAIYDFSAIVNRDHYTFDALGEPLYYSGINKDK